MRRLALALVILTPLTVLGQRPSHLDDPDEPLPKDIIRMLDARSGGRSPKINNELLRRLIEQMPRNIDPKQFDERMLRNLIRDNPELRDPENIKRVRELIEQQQRERPNPMDPKIDWKNIDNTLKKVDDFRKQQKIEPVQPVDKNDLNNPPAEKKKTDSKGEEQMPVRKQPDRQAEEFARWAAKNLGDSPATRDIIQDFAKIMTQDGGRGGAANLLKDLEKEWKGLAGSNDLDSGKQSSVKWNELANGIKLPDLSGTGSSRPSSGSPDSGSFRETASSSSSSSGTFLIGGVSQGLLLVLVLIALGIAAYGFRYLKQRGLREECDREARRAWPVDPKKVATREDVVKAFEHLSLAKIGLPAVHWHHRQIANVLGGQAPERKEAVDQLAGLYEKARYTPAQEHFTEAEIAAARTRLCQITEVAPS